MDSRMDLSALERSRLLNSLPSSALGHLGLSALAVSEQSHSSALNRLSAASAAAAAAAGASPPDLARAGSPTAGLGQYPGRYLPSTALHSPGASYAMMAGYFGSSSHIPESFKALMPDFQQYWGTSQEAYARQLLTNMYYPYLPYLPATESLSLFAQNSATAAQVQAAQAHAAHHRIYDLHKEALFGPGSMPGGFYPQSLLLATQPSSQMEATNLSMSTSNKSKQKEDKEKHKHTEPETGKPNESAKSSDVKTRIPDEERPQVAGGSERTRGINVKKPGDDYLKYRSGDGIKKPNSTSASTSSLGLSKAEHERKRSKLEAVLRQAKENSEESNSAKSRLCKSEKLPIDKPRNEKLSSPVTYNDYFMPISAFSPSRSTVFHSPTRNDRVISPDKRSSKAHSPVRSHKISSPTEHLDISLPIQDKPENLCVKDRNSNPKDIPKPGRHKNVVPNSDTVIVKTQSIVTGTTVTVTSTLNVITSDLSPNNQRKNTLKESASSPKHLSPTSGTTTTTYSLPYYHNLYSRSQSSSQDGKKVHAVTYVPEIGTISSPFAGTPPVIEIKNVSKDGKGREIIEQHSDKYRPGSESPNGKPVSHSLDVSVGKSSPKPLDTITKVKETGDSNIEIESSNKEIKLVGPDNVDNIEKDSSKISASIEILNHSKEGDPHSEKIEAECVHKSSSENLKRKKSVSPNLPPDSKKSTDITIDKSSIVDPKDPTSPPNRDNSCLSERKDKTREMDSNAANTSSTISVTTVVSSKSSEVPCDMNHNSKSAQTSSVKISDVKCAHKPVQSEILKRHENLRRDSSNTVDEKDNSRKSCKNSVDKPIQETVSDKHDTENESKKSDKSDSGKTACRNEKVLKSKETDKGTSKDKKEHGLMAGSTIPVGIAVARQRNIAPKTDKEPSKTSDDVRGKVTAAAEIKPVRPLKIIRPSSKGKPHGATDFRNELPANLIVTGGNNNSGLFWSNDQTSRQLAAHYLQTSNQLNTSNWYGQGHLTFPASNQTPASEAGQLPISVPPGFKLAQDSLTGDILLIPSATDVYDSNRMFPGFHLGTQNAQSYAHSVLTTPQTQSNIPTAASPFFSQSSLNEPTHYQPPFSTEVLPRPDTSVKEEKREINTQQSTDSIMTSTVSLASGQDNGPVSMIVQHDIDKDKLMTVPPPSFVTDLSLTTGQQCAYAFHPPTMPYIFNASVLPVHNIAESSAEVNQSKLEHTSVQSRGTSPMLPATDSSNEENEDCGSQPDEKTEKVEDKTDDNIDKVKTDLKANLDFKEEIITSDFESEQVQAENESNQIDIEIKDETEDVQENSKDSICDPKNCTSSEVTDKIIPPVDLERHNAQSPKTDETVSQDTCIKSPKSEIDDLSKIAPVNPERETRMKCLRTKTDRNIFDDLTEYNPFTDPQILQAADGLELLSALAEKSSLCSKMQPADTGNFEKPEAGTVKEDIYTFKEDKISTSESLPRKPDADKTDKMTVNKSPKETQKPKKSRIKCGYAFKPTKTPEPAQTTPVRMTTFCGITIPEDDDVIDSIEMEMKMRLVELQRRYREKQKELIKLKPKKEKEKEKGKEEEKEKEPVAETEKIDPKRGRGRPKKRKHDSEENSTQNSESQSPKPKLTKKEAVSSSKCSQNGRHSKTHISSHTSQHSNGVHGNQISGSHSNSGNGTHGSSKKKKLAEMLVDRVFRKTGSSFKIPLSKKISLIAPARIEFPGASCNTTEKTEPSQTKKPLDFRRLIKGSRLSQLNGKDRSFDGGLWRRKEEKRKHSQSTGSNEKQEKQKKPKKHEVENGLGLLAEYAAKYRKEKEKEKEKEKTDKTEKSEKSEKIEKTKKKRKTEDTNVSSPESPNKKRKPGRPKKCDLIKPGVTETIVAKQSKHMDFFRWQKDENKQERKISLEGKTPLKPLYLDEWNVRRSERIFLSDSSPQTSPNTVSPSVKPKASDTKSKASDDKDKGKDSSKTKNESVKKQKSTNLQDISQKLKKKYSTTFNQKSREKTTELLKARDQLTKKRHKKKIKKLSKKEEKEVSDSDASTDDLPLSSLKAGSTIQALPSCIIDKEELEDGLRILIFMDGLFHEGEIKAIRPPDVYGAVLDNERRTRPHICSQEEILRDAIKDVKPKLLKQVKEGTRICAYWSQQFSCLYPGTVSKASPDEPGDKSLVNVEFDDGDNGRIPLDHIRMIPHDFPVVEYDPHPLLLLTKRRRTLSNSESNEPRISCSNIPSSPKENKVKRGPGRPPKADRLISEESVGDEDVFTNGDASDGKQDMEDKKSDKSENTSSKKPNNEKSVQSNTTRQLWKWSGSSTKRPGLKGKAKKEYYKCIVRGRETIMVGECAVFLSTGRPNLPYVGRIESLWESWGGQMVVKVKWFYHPEETKGGKRLQNMKGALFRSDHEDENDVQTISHKCEVLKYEEFRRRKAAVSLDELSNVYYLAGSYQPTIGHIKFEPGVIS